MSEPGGKRWLTLSLALGVALVAVSAMGYAMQSTDQAAFCGSCHAMDTSFWTFGKSGHAKLACNDCHAPQNLAAKIPFKAQAGSADIWATVSRNIPDVIHASKLHKDVIQANCVRCHQPTLQTVAMDAKPWCVDCHRSVPHKSRTPISTRKVADG